MQPSVCRAARLLLAAGLTAAILAVPGLIAAQTFPTRPQTTTPAVGERYHIEVGGTFWNPTVGGVIAVDSGVLVGSSIDFVDDLGFEQTRFREFRAVLRPGRKHRLRVQYTPIRYTADSTMTRTVTFAGQEFPVTVPVSSKFDWTVWRFGYEYDFIYRNRGFLGVLVDVRHTTLDASLSSPVGSAATRATAPLPAIGLVGRAYVLPEVALNFEVSGFRFPESDRYSGDYFDWDVHGTVNLTENLGVQLGWRRMTTSLTIDNNFGDLKFQGIWFGAAVRY